MASEEVLRERARCIACVELYGYDRNKIVSAILGKLQDNEVIGGDAINKYMSMVIEAEAYDKWERKTFGRKRR